MVVNLAFPVGGMSSIDFYVLVQLTLIVLSRLCFFFFFFLFFFCFYSCCHVLSLFLFYMVF